MITAVSTSAMVSRTRGDTVISPSPGSSMTMVPTRAKLSRNAAASTGRNETSSCMAGAYLVPPSS
jgi:hypothetical protein